LSKLLGSIASVAVMRQEPGKKPLQTKRNTLRALGSPNVILCYFSFVTVLLGKC
jgi:hypothetical protein